MVVYLDMDGVLSDFQTQACEWHGWNPKAKINNVWNFYESHGLTSQEFWRPLDNYNFWRTLKEYRWAAVLVKALRNGNHEIVFCTTPLHSSAAFRAKVDWLRSRDWYRREEIILMQHKERLANNNVVLIDDYNVNCERFLKAGGWAILFTQPWNGSKRPDARTVKKVLARVNDISKCIYNY